jgi:hypothetical protein
MDEERPVGHAIAHETASAAAVGNQGLGVYDEVLHAELKIALGKASTSAFLLLSFAMSAALRQSATGAPEYFLPPPLNTRREGMNARLK